MATFVDQLTAATKSVTTGIADWFSNPGKTWVRAQATVAEPVVDAGVQTATNAVSGLLGTLIKPVYGWILVALVGAVVVLIVLRKVGV